MHISIKQHAFTVRTVYTEGTVLTKAEAQALNALRAENIRNNCFKLVAEQLLLASGVLPAGVHRRLQEQVTEYDLKYQFPQRQQEKSSASPIEAETLAVATERTEAKMRQSGETWSRQEYEAQLADFLAQPTVQAEARKRVALANAAAARALEDLL